MLSNSSLLGVHGVCPAVLGEAGVFSGESILWLVWFKSKLLGLSIELSCSMVMCVSPLLSGRSVAVVSWVLSCRFSVDLKIKIRIHKNQIVGHTHL